eukprot:symbB.v1.2.029608.t1/scaffold3264.1/size60040/3
MSLVTSISMALSHTGLRSQGTKLWADTPRCCLVSPLAMRWLCARAPLRHRVVGGNWPRFIVGSAGRPHRMQHFWSDGVVEVKEGSSKDLMLLFGLTARDVRLLGTNGAHLSIRPDYFMFRLPPFTGCAWSDSVMIRIEGEDSRAANLFCECLKEELASPKGTQMPFEFLVLEVALRESFEEKKDRLYRLAAMINAALIFRSAGSETELRVGDFLVPSQKRVKQEHMLYKLLMLSNSLSALEVDVRRHEACLESVLRSDEVVGG